MWLVLTCIVLLALSAMWLIEVGSRKCYSKIGAQANAASDNYIALTRLKPRKDAIDYYQMGCVYDFVYKSPTHATHYYKKALGEIDLNAPRLYDNYVLKKIVDRKNINVRLEMDDVRINMDDVIVSKPPVAPAPLRRKKVEIAKRIDWVPDTQNVHDGAIYDEFGKRVEEIRKRVVAPMDFDESVEFLRNFPLKDDRHRAKALKLMDHIARFNPYVYKAEMKEKELVAMVVSDITTHPQERQETLMENLMLNMDDAENKGNPVCISGRIVRLLDIYTDGETVSFKSAQVIKNEMLEVAAAAQKKYLEEAGPEVAADYNRDVQSPEVAALKDGMLKKIMAEVKDVGGATPENLKNIEKEIKENCI